MLTTSQIRVNILKTTFFYKFEPMATNRAKYFLGGGWTVFRCCVCGDVGLGIMSVQ